MSATNNTSAGQCIGRQTADNVSFVIINVGSNVNHNYGTATSTAGAATINAQTGVITTESLTTAAGATYAMTLTNNLILSTDICIATVQNGTSTTGVPVVTTSAVSAGQAVITIQNIHASAAFNGTLKIGFFAP